MTLELRKDILPGKQRASERERERERGTFKLLIILALPPSTSALLLTFAAVFVSVKLRVVCKTLSQYVKIIGVQMNIKLQRMLMHTQPSDT